MILYTNDFINYFCNKFAQDVRKYVEFEVNSNWINDPNSLPDDKKNKVLRMTENEDDAGHALFFSGALLYQLFVGTFLWEHEYKDSSLWIHELKPLFYKNSNEWFEVGGTLYKHICYVQSDGQLVDVLKWFGLMPLDDEKELFVSALKFVFSQMDECLLQQLDDTFVLGMKQKENVDVVIERYADPHYMYGAYAPEMNDVYIEQVDMWYAPLKKYVDKMLNQLVAELTKVVARDKEHLKELIKKAIEEKGPNCDLNFIDVSHVTDMGHLFHDTVFNGDISKWDVSNVTNMDGMFFKAWKFDGDISRWNVSKVTDMTSMFSCGSAFNGDISRWDVSNVKKIRAMFCQSAFAGDISRWKVADNLDMTHMFEKCPLKTENRLPPWYKETKEDKED